MTAYQCSGVKVCIADTGSVRCSLATGHHTAIFSLSVFCYLDQSSQTEGINVLPIIVLHIALAAAFRDKKAQAFFFVSFYGIIL